jgi:hypothetical protein
MILDEASWHRLARAEYPVRYAVFQRLPGFLSAQGRRVRGLWRRARALHTPPTFREVILFDAFRHFCLWVEDNKARVSKDLPVEAGEEGPATRYNTRLAEVRELYQWWTVARPAYAAKVVEMDPDIREFSLIDLELEDEHNFSRLANLWRDLT